MKTSHLFWPDNQAQLNKEIQNWRNEWNILSTEEDKPSQQYWKWMPGQWIEYTSSQEAINLGETPLPIFSNRLPQDEWNQWMKMASQNWGQPRESRLIQYHKYGGELVILPNGKQFSRKTETLWGGRLGLSSALFALDQWDLKNERFPMEQFFEQRIDIKQYCWEKSNHIQYILKECLEEKGQHWFSCQVMVPFGNYLGDEWKQWVQWGGQQYRSREQIKPFWGDYEMKLTGSNPFISFNLV